MRDEEKTREQLIRELETARRRIAELGASEVERNRVGEGMAKSEEKENSVEENSSDGIVHLDLEGMMYEIIKERKREEESAGTNDEEWEFVEFAKEELRRSHERFVAVMDRLNAGVYVVDMERDEVLFVNRYTRDVFGDEEGNIRWEDLERSEGDVNIKEKLVDGNGEPSGVYVWEDMIGGRSYELQDRAIRWVDGRIVRLGVATDITERKEAEEKLLEQERRLASVETLRQTLMTLSHHINNAMTAISGRAQMCDLGLFSADKLIEVCLSQTERISAVLGALDRMVEEMDIRTTDYVGIQNAMFDIEEELRRTLGDT